MTLREKALVEAAHRLGASWLVVDTHDRLSGIPEQERITQREDYERRLQEFLTLLRPPQPGGSTVYAIRIGTERFKVRGAVQENGWLLWTGLKDTSDQGVSPPDRWCDWPYRSDRFPDCVDAADQ